MTVPLVIKSKFLTLLAALVLAIVISSVNVFSEDFSTYHFRNQISHYLIGIGLFFAITISSISKGTIDELFKLLVLSNAMSIIFSIRTYFQDDLYRYSGFNTNVVELSILSVISALYLYDKLIVSKTKFVYGIPIFLFMLAAFLSGTKSSLLALIIALLPRLSFKQLVPLVIVFLGIWHGEFFNDRLVQRFENDNIFDSSNRLVLWQSGWLAAKKNWILGIGIGQYAADNASYLLDFGLQDKVSINVRGHQIGLHNTYLMVLVEWGLLSFLLFIMFLTKISKDVFQKLNSYESSLLIVLLISAFFRNILIFPSFWLLLGILTKQKSEI